MAPVAPSCGGEATTAGERRLLRQGCFVYGDTFAFMVLERMQGRRGATAGPLVICRTHVQGLSRACHMDLAGQAKVDNESDKPAV